MPTNKKHWLRVTQIPVFVLVIKNPSTRSWQGVQYGIFNINTGFLHCLNKSNFKKKFLLRTLTTWVLRFGLKKSFSSRIFFNFLSALQYLSVKSNLNGLFYFPRIRTNVTETYFVAQRTKQTAYAEDKLQRPLSASWVWLYMKFINK